MLPLYKKMLLVSQINLTIFQSTETYWDLDDHFDEIIEMQGAYTNVNIQIQEAARAGQRTLDKYTKKIDTETLIIYSAAILDPRHPVSKLSFWRVTSKIMLLMWLTIYDLILMRSLLH
jgi:hypothetical protein